MPAAAWAHPNSSGSRNKMGAKDYCRLLLQKKGREAGKLVAAQSYAVYYAACRSTRMFATLGDPMPEARS